MKTNVLRGLSVALLGLMVLAGCESQAPEPVDPEPVQEPVREETPPTVTVPPRPKTTDDGVPLDQSGQPIGTVFYFEFDRSELKARARTLLAGHAAWLRENPGVRVTVQGHADERGTREYNLALGERRAAAVRSYLQSVGVRSSQVSIVSYGEERPVDPGHTESAWSRNRRAELVY